LQKEWTLAELDTWLCTYRDIIIQSKKNTAIEKKKRAKRRKNREHALNAMRKRQKTHTNSHRRIYQTRQHRKRQETINTLINTLESDSDNIISSEVSSDDNTESDTSSIYGTEDDSIKSGGLHSLDSNDIT